MSFATEWVAAVLLTLAVTLAVALAARARLHRARALRDATFEPDELQQLILSTLTHYYPRRVPLDLLHRTIVAARPDLPGNTGGPDRTHRELSQLEAARLVCRNRRGRPQFGLTERGRDWVAGH